MIAGVNVFNARSTFLSFLEASFVFLCTLSIYVFILYDLYIEFAFCFFLKHNIINN